MKTGHPVPDTSDTLSGHQPDGHAPLLKGAVRSGVLGESRLEKRAALSGKIVEQAIAPSNLPILWTADETAALLRTTRTAVYAMVARKQIPGIVRIGRRVLFRRDDLLRWLDQNRAPSPKE